jgi:hypothetical protein
MNTNTATVPTEIRRQAEKSLYRQTRLILLLKAVLFAATQMPGQSASQTAPRPPFQPPQGAKEALECRRESIEPAQRTRQRMAEVAACSVDDRQLSQVLARKGSVVVDARSTTAREHIRIPDSLPISASELRYRDALRRMPLLLVGDGKDDATLLEQCVLLRQSNFQSVAVLRGGLATWAGAGQPVIAKADALDGLQRMNADELLRASLETGNTILLGPDTYEFRKLLRNTVGVASLEPGAIAAALSKTPHARAAVIVSTAPLSAESLRALSAQTRMPVYNFSGDSIRFEAYLRTQLAIWKRAEGGERVHCPGL